MNCSIKGERKNIKDATFDIISGSGDRRAYKNALHISLCSHMRIGQWEFFFTDIFRGFDLDIGTFPVFFGRCEIIFFQ